MERPEFKLDFAKDEYLFLQNQFEDFDKRSLTIKGWISTGAIAALTLSLDQKFTAHHDTVAIIVIAMAMSFWIIEATWKIFQEAFIHRILFLEATFRGELYNLPPGHPDMAFNFQTYSAWKYAFKYNLKPIDFMIKLLKPSVFFPYALISLLSIWLILR